jgi:hypothetical protein
MVSEEVIWIKRWLAPARRQKLHVFSPNRVFCNCVPISTEILGAASVAYTDGNVGQTRNTAQIGFLSERDPQTALVEASEFAEIAKLVVHGVFLHWLHLGLFGPVNSHGGRPASMNYFTQRGPSHHRPQSSSASRFTAGASGFLNFSQSGERPDL